MIHTLGRALAALCAVIAVLGGIALVAVIIWAVIYGAMHGQYEPLIGGGLAVLVLGVGFGATTFFFNSRP